jgi:hypothetical protein
MNCNGQMCRRGKSRRSLPWNVSWLCCCGRCKRVSSGEIWVLLRREEVGVERRRLSHKLLSVMDHSSHKIFAQVSLGKNNHKEFTS